LRALPGEAVIEDHDLVGPTLPLAHQPGTGLQLRAETYRGLSAFLQLLCDLAQLALRLRAETTQSNFLYAVRDRSDQQLAADMCGSIHLVKTAPLLAKLADVELKEARERLPAGILLSDDHLPSPVGRSFDQSEPVDRPAIGILASRHLATGVTQAGKGSAHGMRQPAEPLPDLGDRGALGPFEHADQNRALCARSRSVGVWHPRRHQIGALQCGLGL